MSVYSQNEWSKLPVERRRSLMRLSMEPESTLTPEASAGIEHNHLQAILNSVVDLSELDVQPGAGDTPAQTNPTVSGQGQFQRDSRGTRG